MPEVDTVTNDKYACAFATKDGVRVLTGVTERCWWLPEDNHPQSNKIEDFHGGQFKCPDCHGLAEVPVDDLEKWIESIKPLLDVLEYEPSGGSPYPERVQLEFKTGLGGVGTGHSFMEAFFAALKQALVDSGEEQHND